MSVPLVSVIMPNYNSEKFISDAIKSVINQVNFFDLELIIIDDNSNDRSVEIIKNHQKNDDRIIFIKSASNTGPGLARNKGLSISRGKYITFIDSDDIWHLDKLSIQIKVMEKLKIAITHTDYGYIDSKGNVSDHIFRTSKYAIDFDNLLKRTEISCLTVIYNRKLIGLEYFPDIKRKQDYVVWLNILKKGFESIPIHTVTGFYRQQSRAKTFNRLNFVYSHFILLRSKYVGLSLFKSIYYTLCYLFNGVFRYIKFINN
jgi:teichuronic acid biosynthesis glycosyltransferase TuaG